MNINHSRKSKPFRHFTVLKTKTAEEFILELPSFLTGENTKKIKKLIAFFFISSNLAVLKIDPEVFLT